MANQWFRMYAEFATDPKVQMLSEVNQRRLTMLFCLRCNGDVTLHDEEIAFQLRVSMDEWLVTKEEFVAKKFIDDTNKILNWDKRQYVSDSSTSRVYKHREKMKRQCNVTVTPPDTDTDTDTEQKEVIGDASDEAPKPEKSKNKKPSRLPEEWVCTPELGEWAMGMGLTREEVVSEIDGFVDHWSAATGKGSTALDWDAKFRTWVRNCVKWKNEKRK